MTLEKKNLESLLEPAIYLSLENSEYNIEEVNAKNLLTHKRFDLAFKLFFLNYFELNKELSLKIYNSHINAFTQGKFKEPDKKEKNSSDSFVSSFLDTLDSIRNHGFNDSISLIPLSKDGHILNGAHRTAVSIFLNQTLKTVTTEKNDSNYNYEFFFKRGVPPEFLDVAATEFAKSAENVYIALLWPVAEAMEKEITSILNKVIYRKEIVLNPNGAHNLMSEVYAGEKWLGSVDNNYKGTIGKSSKCFKGNRPIRVYMFQAGNLEIVLDHKNKIRELFGMGKHAIHITDSKEEVFRLSELLFNENSIHFLNYAKPNKNKDFHKRLDLFENFVKKNNINKKSVILDSGMVLGSYGVRMPRDVDYLIDKPIEVPHEDSISCHNDFEKHYSTSLLNLIYDPQFHFYFRGFKFISLNETYTFKNNRSENKDLMDAESIKALLSDDKEAIAKQRKVQQRFLLMQKLRYLPISLSIGVLRSLSLYDITRKWYHKLKR